jgi:hypothetical protein
MSNWAAAARVKTSRAPGRVWRTDAGHMIDTGPSSAAFSIPAWPGSSSRTRTVRGAVSAGTVSVSP